ncbi:MAG: hypothetical protein NZP72_13215 [Geminicoccaceae bacterium]|nr:hypothetical protein [Geminicoccaceae bacterium]
MEVAWFLIGLVVGALGVGFVLQRLCDRRVLETEERVAAELARARAEAREADEAHAETKHQLVALQTRLQSLQAELERAREEASAARHRLASQEALERELAEARATIDRLEREAAAVRPMPPSPPSAGPAEPAAPPSASGEAALRAELRTLEARLAMLPAGSSAAEALKRRRAELKAELARSPRLVESHPPVPREEHPVVAREEPLPAVEPERKAPAEGPPPRDDLKLIKGIGPVLERRLNELGIRTFADLAALTPERAKEIDAAIEFPGRVERERWVEQAKEILARRGR